MSRQSSDPFERAGDVLGYIIAVLALASLFYAMLPAFLPWLYR